VVEITTKNRRASLSNLLKVSGGEPRELWFEMLPFSAGFLRRLSCQTPGNDRNYGL